MIVIPYKLSEGLELLKEAIQKKQLLKFAKQTDRSAEKILRVIDSVDPTHTRETATGAGKYAQWLLSQWIKHEAAKRSAKWNLDQYIKAVQVGEHTKAFEFAKQADEDQDRVNAHASFDPPDQRARVKSLLNRHQKLLLARRAPEFSIFPDVFAYKTVEELETAIKSVPAEAFLTRGEIKRGKIDPMIVPGSRPVFQRDDLIIFEINTSRAAQVHAARTSMCFRDGDYATKYTRRGPLYLAYSSNPEVFRLFTKAPEAHNIPGFKKVFAFTWDSMFGQHLESPRHSRHLWEIRDTENDWLFSARIDSIPGLIDALKGLTKGRNRGFDKWIEAGTGNTFVRGADPSDVAPDTERPEERITIATYGEEEQAMLFPEEPEEEPEEEEEPGEEHSPHAVLFTDNHGLRIDDEGDIQIPFDDDPRGQANQEYFNTTWSEAMNHGTYARAVVDDESFWYELGEHMNGESLNDTREMEIRSEGEESDWDRESEEKFKEGLKAEIWKIGVEESRTDDEEKLVALGIPWEEWEDAIDEHESWRFFLEDMQDIYYEWEGEYPSINFQNYLEDFDRDEAGEVRKYLDLESEAEAQFKREREMGQQFFPYFDPEDIRFEAVLDRILGRSRTVTERSSRTVMRNILHGVPDWVVEAVERSHQEATDMLTKALQTIGGEWGPYMISGEGRRKSHSPSTWDRVLQGARTPWWSELHQWIQQESGNRNLRYNWDALIRYMLMSGIVSKHGPSTQQPEPKAEPRGVEVEPADVIPVYGGTISRKDIGKGGKGITYTRGRTQARTRTREQ